MWKGLEVRNVRSCRPREGRGRKVAALVCVKRSGLTSVSAFWKVRGPGCSIRSVACRTARVDSCRTRLPFPLMYLFMILRLLAATRSDRGSRLQS